MPDLSITQLPFEHTETPATPLVRELIPAWGAGATIGAKLYFNGVVTTGNFKILVHKKTVTPDVATDGASYAGAIPRLMIGPDDQISILAAAQNDVITFSFVDK